MRQVTEGLFKQSFSLDNHTGRFLKQDMHPVPLFPPTRRFSCIFLSASAKDAANLNHHLSAAGIRAYHAADTREVELLLMITKAKVLLIDIDCGFEPGLDVLRRLDESHSDLPKVVLTASDENAWAAVLPRLAFDIVPKPVHLGELLGALEHAQLAEKEINDPDRARRREMRVIAAIGSASQPRTSKHVQPNREEVIVSIPHSILHAIRVRLSAMMDKVAHVSWKFGYHRTRKQDSHA